MCFNVKSKNMENIIKDYFDLDIDIQQFLQDITRSRLYFDEAVIRYSLDPVSCELTIKYTDLWIEKYINEIPSLSVYRDYVRKAMDDLGIDRYPDIYYLAENNHYCSRVEKSKERIVKALKQQN